MALSNLAGRLQVQRGDITALEVDAIVNAANAELAGGGGVDGAIHAAAGPELMAACREIGGCDTGSAVITAAYRLPAKFVIHAVGPIWSGGDKDEDELLAGCYRRSLELAREHDVETIAFPNISCGVYGFPLERAARISVAEIAAFLETEALPERVTLCCFGADTEHACRAALAEHLGRRP